VRKEYAEEKPVITIKKMVVGAAKRNHEVKQHKRTTQNGKVTTVKSHTRGKTAAQG
jgi:hypothetical protein